MLVVSITLMKRMSRVLATLLTKMNKVGHNGLLEDLDWFLLGSGFSRERKGQ